MEMKDREDWELFKLVVESDPDGPNYVEYAAYEELQRRGYDASYIARYVERNAPKVILPEVTTEASFDHYVIEACWTEKE